MGQPPSAEGQSGQVAVVFGASGGIGRALVTIMAQSRRYSAIHAGSRTTAKGLPGGVQSFTFDFADERSIEQVAQAIGRPADVVLVATGLLHDDVNGISPEKSYRAIDGAAMAAVLAANTIGPALVARHFLPLLPRRSRAVFAALSARVGSISDNRLGGWHSYRASKAALNMLIANFAVEMSRTHSQAVIAALHPGTVDTGLSLPFQGNVPDKQLFTPEVSARHLLSVIDSLTPQDSGGLFAWDGKRLSW